MRLDDLFGGDLDVGTHGDLDVTTVENDSRQCVPGSLFFAMPGATTNGAAFVAEAIDRGAVAVVAATANDAPVPTWLVEPPKMHELLVRASATIVRHPERDIALFGVTGTNGKTSVTTIFARLWRALGHASDVIGTLTHERTTPAPPELFRAIRNFADRSNSATAPTMAIEVSSHALSQGRVDGLVFDVAAFTNLTLDHLDYHGTMEEYFAAKATLFDPHRCRQAVIWIDDEYGRRLATTTGVPVVTVQRTQASRVTFDVGATTFQWRGRAVHTALSGQYNLDNVLIVLATAVQFGVNEDDAVAALAQVPPVRGRFDVLRDASPTVIVDYAHTPDGLERLLDDVRRLAGNGRVIVVFGCGGDRDRLKRPLMGEIATRLADLTIVTSDNPRFEDPDAIIDEIVAGCHDDAEWRRQGDRRLAIRDALEAAETNDVVVLAGKGHETTQIIGTDTIEFDDRLVASAWLTGS